MYGFTRGGIWKFHTTAFYRAAFCSLLASVCEVNFGLCVQTMSLSNFEDFPLFHESLFCPIFQNKRRSFTKMKMAGQLDFELQFQKFSAIQKFLGRFNVVSMKIVVSDLIII